MPALAIKQDEGLDVLESRAKELQASSFTVVPEHPQFKDIKLGEHLFLHDGRELDLYSPFSRLGLAGVHQRSNASLAVALVRTFLASKRCPSAFSSIAATTSSTSPDSATGPEALPTLPSDLVAPTPLPSDYVSALERTTWPGRCQLSTDPSDARVRWYLDGAHTVESLQCCGEWFAEEALTR